MLVFTVDSDNRKREALMRMVTFKDGGRMDWNDYRRMMNGEISPRAAVARMRREPLLALDAALPRRQVRDQPFEKTSGGGRLTPEFYRATLSYLAQNGVPDDVVQQIAGLLGDHVEEEAEAEDSENLKMPEEKQIRVGGQQVPTLPDGKSAAAAAYDGSCARISLLWKPKRQIMNYTTLYIRGISVL
jgi:hypothetical protein